MFLMEDQSISIPIIHNNGLMIQMLYLLYPHKLLVMNFHGDHPTERNKKLLRHHKDHHLGELQGTAPHLETRSGDVWWRDWKSWQT